MSAVVGFFDAFGYHKGSFEDPKEKKFVKTMNTMNAVGYIPVVGSVVGVLRIAAAVDFAAVVDSMTQSSRNRAFQIGQIVRGILEILCLSLVVGLFVDLPVTIVRLCSGLCSGRNANQNSSEL